MGRQPEGFKIRVVWESLEKPDFDALKKAYAMIFDDRLSYPQVQDLTDNTKTLTFKGPKKK